MVTCYARLSGTQLQQMDSSPTTLARIHQNVPPGAEVIDLDKASGVLAWLLSPCKRAEQIQFASIINEELGEELAPAYSLQPVPPLDDFAICIEGRGPKKIKFLDVGCGPACEFEPAEVRRFSDLLATIDESVLRRELNFELMDTMHLPVEYWQEEGEETFTRYIVPQFEKLRRFYEAAANANQSVLVWYS
ncbi:MAG: DUF1877 family protein [Pirellulaceae bacterium]